MELKAFYKNQIRILCVNHLHYFRHLRKKKTTDLLTKQPEVLKYNWFLGYIAYKHTVRVHILNVHNR